MYSKNYNRIIGTGIRMCSEQKGFDAYNLLQEIKFENTEGRFYLPQMLKILRGDYELGSKQFQEICRILETTGVDIFLTGLSALKREDYTGHEKEVVDIAIQLARKLIVNNTELERLKRVSIEDLGDRFNPEEKEEVIIMKDCAIDLANVMKKYGLQTA